MLPRTFIGWVFLIVVVAVLVWGAGGAGAHLGNAVHEVLAGVRSFAAGLRG